MFQTPCLEVVFFSYIFRKRNEISFLSVKLQQGLWKKILFSLASSMIHKFMIEMNQIQRIFNGSVFPTFPSRLDFDHQAMPIDINTKAKCYFDTRPLTKGKEKSSKILFPYLNILIFSLERSFQKAN